MAQTFTFTAEDGTSLSEVAHLDTMVTVVDASAIFPVISSMDKLKESAREKAVAAFRSALELHDADEHSNALPPFRHAEALYWVRRACRFELGGPLSVAAALTHS